MTIRLSQLLTVRYWGTIVLDYLRILVPILANIAQNMILSIVHDNLYYYHMHCGVYSAAAGQIQPGRM